MAKPTIKQQSVAALLKGSKLPSTSNPLAMKVKVDPALKPKKKKSGPSMLEKVQQAEAELRSVRPGDVGADQAKFNVARMKSEQTRIDSNDTEYYICICFESYHQKIAFLEKLRLLRDDQDTYFSGKETARALGFKLTDDHRAFHSLPVNRRWRRFALPIPEGAEPAE